jgi:hypothetical protein
MGAVLRCLPWLARATLLAAFGCGIDPDAEQAPLQPQPGLYTPGNLLGAGGSMEPVVEDPGLGDRCTPLATPTGSLLTAGTLQIEYQTQSQDGRYAPRNCTAVWIETPAMQYVATLELTAGLRRPGLVYFQDHACTSKLGPDAVTSATRTDHVKAHSAIWNAVDFNGQLVPDGPYKLFIEVTESDKEPGESFELDFSKVATPFTIDAPVDVDGPLLQLKLTWKPKGSTGGAAGSN